MELYFFPPESVVTYSANSTMHSLHKRYQVQEKTALRMTVQRFIAVPDDPEDPFVFTPRFWSTCIGNITSSTGQQADPNGVLIKEI